VALHCHDCGVFVVSHDCGVIVIVGAASTLCRAAVGVSPNHGMVGTLAVIVRSSDAAGSGSRRALTGASCVVDQFRLTGLDASSQVQVSAGPSSGLDVWQPLKLSVFLPFVMQLSPHGPVPTPTFPLAGSIWV
jgi:hypothetical protein